MQTKADGRKRKELGALIAVYRGRPFGRGTWLTYCLLGMAATLTPLGYGSQRFVYGYTKFGLAAATTWSRTWFLLTLLALISSWLLLFHRRREARRYVALHQNGLRLALSGQRPQKKPTAQPMRPATGEITLRWEQISGIAVNHVQPHLFGRTLKPRYRAYLYPNLGRPIRLDDRLGRVAELLTQIKAHLYPRLLPELQQSFAEGRWLYFGRLAIHREAIQLRSSPFLRPRWHTFPWEQVERLGVADGCLVVELRHLHPYRRSAKIRIPIAQVPNPEILLEIVRLGVPT